LNPVQQPLSGDPEKLAQSIVADWDAWRKDKYLLKTNKDNELKPKCATVKLPFASGFSFVALIL